MSKCLYSANYKWYCSQERRVFGSWELISVVRVKTEIRFEKQWLQPHPKTTLKECGRIYYTFSSKFINTNSFYVELNFRNALAASTRECPCIMQRIWILENSVGRKARWRKFSMSVYRHNKWKFIRYGIRYGMWETIWVSKRPHYNWRKR